MLRFSICLTADAAYRLCVCSWGSSHFPPSASFIPQSSPEALVYSNQGLAEQCQKAFHSGIWHLLSFGCTVEPRVPALILPQPNNNNSWSAKAWQRASHFTAGSQHPGPAGAKCHTIAISSHPALVGKRDPLKQQGLLSSLEACQSFFFLTPFFWSAGIPASVRCSAPLLFIHLLPLFFWLPGCGTSGGKVTFWLR